MGGWKRKRPCTCHPRAMFRLRGLEFRVWGVGFGVQGSGFRVWGSGFAVQGMGFRVWVSEFGGWGSVFGVQGCGPHLCFGVRPGILSLAHTDTGATECTVLIAAALRVAS